MVEILNLRARSPSSSPAGLTSEPSSTPPPSGDDGQGNNNPLVESIMDGLANTEPRYTGETEEDKLFTYTKHIPTMVLYDDKGLDIYDAITQCDEYYLYNSELSILQKYGADIARCLFASTSKASDSLTQVKQDDSVPALSEDGTSSTGTSNTSEHGEAETESGEDYKRDDDSPEKEEQYQNFGKGAKVDAKEKWGDSKVGRNNYGVNGNLGLDEKVAPSTGSVIELGAGSLKKTGVLLKALSALINDTGKSDADREDEHESVSEIKYYALDLEYRQLVETLTQLEESSKDTVTTKEASADVNGGEGGLKKIVAKGICASYEDAFPTLQAGAYDTSASPAGLGDKKCILFLGSSIGNYSRTEAVEFLSKISQTAMRPGDTLLIGIDSCNDKERIERAYNDTQGVTEDFILNGVDHVDRILGGVGLDRQDFAYKNRYNVEKGRHEAYIVPKKDISFTYNSKSVSFSKDELVRIERSYKYTTQEAISLFASSGLRVVQRWSDDARTSDGSYHLWLVEKAAFSFESTLDVSARGENPFGLPTLNEWARLWRAWDCVTLDMIPRDLLHSKPIDLRHICLFYLGHIPGFLDIHMSRYLKEPYTEPAHYPDMFERGIDPNMDDPSKVHAHSVVPTKMEDWPCIEDIVVYRDRVRARLNELYANRLSGPAEKIDKRLVRTMQMVYEHEVMHLETLLYMCAQIPPGRLNPAPQFVTPDWEALSELWSAQVAEEARATKELVLSYPKSSVSVGHDDFDHLDSVTPYDPSQTLGWDNECPRRDVRVPAFKISLLPISNAEYLAFWQSKNKDVKLTPGSWLVDEKTGQVGVRVLTEPGVVEIEIAKDWPCMASAKQLEAFAHSLDGRLPTEPELRRYIVDHPFDHVGANIGFRNWHPVPAKLPLTLRDGTQTGASNGGVWEWTSTNFEAWEGWRASELYPDYSRDFFDGCHSIMLGGSFATIPRIAGRKTFTNWYQSNYPYVFAGARVAYDV